VIGIAGWSGAGKTTLIVRLIPILRQRGLSVSTLKHAHHAFDVDRPGKDSFAHREAGASEVLVASANRWALLHELREEEEPKLADHLRRLSPVDIVLVEGFKRDQHNKIEINRAANNKPFLWLEDQSIMALVSDVEEGLPAHLPHVGLDEIEAIADLSLRLAPTLDETLMRLSVHA